MEKPLNICFFPLLTVTLTLIPYWVVRPTCISLPHVQRTFVMTHSGPLYFILTFSLFYFIFFSFLDDEDVTVA